MQPTPELIDAIYRDKVLRARSAPPETKLLAGAELYEYVREISMCGIRMQFPDATPEQLREHHRRRLKISRFMDNHHEC